eukprot:scaffold259958_cov23-Prasinocladus_malaysianus.AAC.1
MATGYTSSTRSDYLQVVTYRWPVATGTRYPGTLVSLSRTGTRVPVVLLRQAIHSLSTQGQSLRPGREDRRTPSGRAGSRATKFDYLNWV